MQDFIDTDVGATSTLNFFQAQWHFRIWGWANLEPHKQIISEWIWELQQQLSSGAKLGKKATTDVNVDEEKTKKPTDGACHMQGDMTPGENLDIPRAEMVKSIIDEP